MIPLLHPRDRPLHLLLPRRVRRVLPAAVDATAALVAGVGVAAMVLRIKPVPAVLFQFLGETYSYIWAVLLLTGSLLAAAGAILRVLWRKRPTTGFFCEYLGWPSIAWSAFIFGLGVGVELGWVTSLLTISFAWFVSLNCVGQWWRLREARIAAISKQQKGAA